MARDARGEEPCKAAAQDRKCSTTECGRGDDVLAAPAFSKAKPWYCTASSLDAAARYCTCCERDLSGGAVRMLELDQRTDTYHDIRGVPEDQSQGWFPFGLTCAKKQLAAHRAKTTN